MNADQLAVRSNGGLGASALVVLPAVAPILTGLLIPSVRKVHDTASRMEASKGLKQVAVAASRVAGEAELVGNALRDLLADALRSGDLDPDELRRLHVELEKQQDRQSDLLHQMGLLEDTPLKGQEQKRLADAIHALRELERNALMVVVRLEIIV